MIFGQFHRPNDRSRTVEKMAVVGSPIGVLKLSIHSPVE